MGYETILLPPNKAIGPLPALWRRVISNMISVTSLLLISGLGVAQADPWEISVSARRESYYTKEPVLVTVKWTNTSGEVKSLARPRITAVSLAAAGEAAKDFYLYEPVELRNRGIHHPGVRIGPGESFAMPLWLLIGRSGGSRKWEFLFRKAGSYRITVPVASKPSCPVNIAEPSKEGEAGSAKP
jgi:hypothetical protein